MDRRTFFVGSAAGLMVTTSGALILANGFAPPKPVAKSPERLSPKESSESWVYHPLDAKKTSDLSYSLYEKGSCMYALFGSIMQQLAEQHGDPYASFPVDMMKYGGSGIGSYGSICGALNGAAAAIGLFVQDKSHRDAIIESLFSWYEKTLLPVYKPEGSEEETVTSISNSVLCHASTSEWVKQSGHSIEGKERSERCMRLTADVTLKTVSLLNDYFAGQYETSNGVTEEAATCMQCHSSKGKMSNIKGKMECSACHDTSLAHTLFADIHYKLME